MAFTLADSTTAGTQTISHYTEAVTGGTLHLVVTASNVPGAPSTQPPSLSFVSSASSQLPIAQYTTSSVTTGSIAQGVVTGAQFSVWAQTGATPGNQLMRTAAQLFADIPGAYAGMTVRFRIINTGAGTLTVAADAGATVTISGTATVAQNTWRDFILTLTSATAATVQSVGVGTQS